MKKYGQRRNTNKKYHHRIIRTGSRRRNETPLPLNEETNAAATTTTSSFCSLSKFSRRKILTVIGLFLLLPTLMLQQQLVVITTVSPENRLFLPTTISATTAADVHNKDTNMVAENAFDDDSVTAYLAATTTNISAHKKTPQMTRDAQVVFADVTKRKPYYKYWNFTTHRLENVPIVSSSLQQTADHRLTSLEILENVMQKTMPPSDTTTEPLSVSSLLENPTLSNTCFKANLTHSWEVVRQFTRENDNNNNQHRKQPPFPILNLGFPKCGTTTLRDFFVCSGYHAGHSLPARCMKHAIDNRNTPLSPRCLHRRQIECQLDTTAEPVVKGKVDKNNTCIYPQISMLDEFHAAAPQATFVLIFRPVLDWIHSAGSWHGHMGKWKTMKDRWNLCQGQVPGLVSYTTPPATATTTKSPPRLSDYDLALWWCRHVLHVREFVQTYPSHTLIELDLYDSKSSSQILTSLFGKNNNKTSTESSCWGKSNVNKKKTNTTA